MIKQFYFRQYNLASQKKLDGSKYFYLSLTIQLNINRLNDQTVLFQTIQFSISITTKLDGSKYFYASLTIQWIISHLFTHS